MKHTAGQPDVRDMCQTASSLDSALPGWQWGDEWLHIHQIRFKIRKACTGHLKKKKNIYIYIYSSLLNLFLIATTLWHLGHRQKGVKTMEGGAENKNQL